MVCALPHEVCRARPWSLAEEEIMQTAIAFLTVVGGLVLSLGVALAAEEFIFGQVIRVFFERQTAAGQKR